MIRPLKATLAAAAFLPALALGTEPARALVAGPQLGSVNGACTAIVPANNANQTNTSGFPTLHLDETFTSVGPCHLDIQVVFEPQPSGTTANGAFAAYQDIAIDKYVFNDPATPIEDWKDFHIEIGLQDVNGMIYTPNDLWFIDSATPPVDISGHFALDPQSDPFNLWFDGSLPVGETAQFWFAIHVPNQGILDQSGYEVSNLVLWQVPTVPEPATLALLSAGLVGLGLVRRRRSKA